MVVAGKVCLISGGSSGVGAACAAAIMEHGTQIAFIARDRDKANSKRGIEPDESYREVFGTGQIGQMHSSPPFGGYELCNGVGAQHRVRESGAVSRLQTKAGQ